MNEPYEPEVNDYVIWERDSWLGKTSDEGWVYFKAPVMESRKGFRDNPRYITIETGVKPKPQCEYGKNSKHSMIHTLLLCYESDWKDLKFVKRRKPPGDVQHYSECDD